jgi:hypothetical protein
MNQTDYVTKMKSRGEYKSAKTNIVDLINRVKLTRKKEKRNVMIVTAVAISALAATGLIITL